MTLPQSRGNKPSVKTWLPLTKCLNLLDSLSPHLLPLDWIGWYSFPCVLASDPVGILPSLASSTLSSSAASASPLSRDLPFYTIQMLSFHILNSVRAKQVNIHIPPPFTLLCSTQDQASSKTVVYVCGLHFLASRVLQNV